MANEVHERQAPSDEPLLDTTPYGAGKEDSVPVADAVENAAVTHHVATIGGKSISYTARAGHLVTTGPSSARPAAKIFCVAFTADDAAPASRPVTFFYNGGPGSSSVFLLLGSFGPRRIRTDMPHFTPPAPYVLEDNPDSLLDRSDLVFLDPVGTGYSAAIAPGENGDFWGVDQDAGSVRQFVKRYLTKFNRWNSPKFLFGESYGTPRTCVLTWLLHEDGVDLNGIVLQSSILDYSKAGDPVGLLPTLAADAWFHHKVTVSPAPQDLASFTEEVEKFARGRYAQALRDFPKVDPDVLKTLSDMLGVPEIVVKYWKLDPSSNNTIFLSGLLVDKGLAIGAYDGRVTGEDDGIAGSVAPNSGGNDPTMTAVGGVYTAMWNVYLNDELKFTSTSPFTDLNDQAFANWDFSHIDPTGTQKGGPASLYTAGDLAAAMALNPYLQVFSANGYFDAVTPFFQTLLTFEAMPVSSPRDLDRLTVHNYPSGHMVYLDNASRSAMKADLAEFYASAATAPERLVERRPSEAPEVVSQSRYRRRLSRTPY
jgi:carboxypeptidase C (cathepsin A)